MQSTISSDTVMVRTAARSGSRLVVAVALIIIAVLVALLLGTGSRLLVSLFTQAVIVSILALGVGFLARSSDLISFGHAAPFGLGAYGAAMVLGSGIPAEIGLPVVLVAVVALFFLIGLLVGRLNGIAFSMLTLAMGQSFFVVVSKFRSVTNGADGMTVSLPRSVFGISTRSLQSPQGMMILATLVLVTLVGLIYLFERSRLGRLAVGLRENEERVRFLGYHTRILKAAIFANSALIAAVAGILFAIYQGFVSPEIMHWSFSGSALIMTILGGTVLVWGPVAGAIAFFFLREWLSGITEHWHAVLGLLLIVVTVAWPGGLSGITKSALRRFGAKQRKGAGE